MGLPLLWRLGAIAAAALGLFISGMLYQMHRQSVAKLEDDLASERAARVLEAQQARNMARTSDALTQDRLRTERHSADLSERLRIAADEVPQPAGCPARNEDTRPAVAVLSDGVRADLVRLAKEADAAADQLSAWQTVRE